MRMPGNPYPGARSAMDPAVCLASGTEIAQWLFWQRRMTGALKTPAKFIASCQSPFDVAPSPKVPSTTSSLPRNLDPMAKPTACGTWVATGTASGAQAYLRGYHGRGDQPRNQVS